MHLVIYGSSRFNFGIILEVGIDFYSYGDVTSSLE